MSNELNDKRILDLKKKIESKKESLNKVTKFSPITNCSIEFEGNRHNIQVLAKEQLIQLLVKLNSLYLSAKDLGINFEISGYNVQDWMTDIKAKVEILSYKDEEKALKNMEDKLHKLLSEGKKVELEIDEIEAMIKS